MLKTLRKNKKLTQLKLGKMAGISQSYISTLEKSYFVSSPTVRQILSLSNSLDVDKSKLFLYFAEKESKNKNKDKQLK